MDFRLLGIAAILGLALTPRAPALFSDAERANIVAYWNAPGRYVVDAPTAPGSNWPWVVRLTPEASIWFHAYNRARGLGKLPPTVAAPPPPAEFEEWEKWVVAKLAFDTWTATYAIHNPERIIGPPPPHPGPIPATLAAAVGNAPEFAAAVAPIHYTVTFDTGEVIRYADHVGVHPRYAYYRFAQGVQEPGRPLRDIPDKELAEAFASAGLSAREARVMRAVSRLEGGFESINTYDTGYVSVGFIQFAALEAGSGSLGAVLAREKAAHRKEFERDFRRFGIDVGEANALVVVDPGTGVELTGRDAARKIIDDKRLTAVFQRAGMSSAAFRAAQIRIARDRYWPEQDSVTVTTPAGAFSGTVADIIRSEAGLATLFDRKVNRGTIEPFAEVVARVMTERGLSRLQDAAKYEREIVAALKYRVDFLAEAGLAQPPALPVEAAATPEAPQKSEQRQQPPAQAASPQADKPELPRQPESPPKSPAAPAEPAPPSPAAETTGEPAPQPDE